jgi:hypothetical protein
VLTGEKNKRSTFAMVMPFVARKEKAPTYTHTQVNNNNNNSIFIYL